MAVFVSIFRGAFNKITHDALDSGSNLKFGLRNGALMRNINNMIVLKIPGWSVIYINVRSVCYILRYELVKNILTSVSILGKLCKTMK